MDLRITQEIELLKKYYPSLIHVVDGNWVQIKNYQIPKTLPWNTDLTDVCFQIPVSYPGSPPYGFYVNEGLLWEGMKPENCNRKPGLKPPFPGYWILLSWQIDCGWFPKSDVHSGSNLLGFVQSINDRFKQGR